MMPKKKTKQEKCNDRYCPVHCNVGYRERTIVGTIISVKGYKTATIGWKRLHPVRKYERFESRKTRIKAHNSPCINAKKGDKVEIRETRPLSKTKNFVIVKVLGRDIEFMEKEEGLEESKVKKEKKKAKAEENDGKKEEAEEKPEAEKEVKEE
jgi:small subunit ribosomal protein S17